MKFLATILLLLLLAPVASYGQVVYHSEFEKHAFESSNTFKILLSSSPEVDLIKYNDIAAEFDELKFRLHEKKERWGASEKFLKWAFYYVHRKSLSWYENYVSFGDLFIEGKYDCLTGTALFALILDDLKIPYEIYEFDFHTFLVARLGDESYLLESTDPLGGFVTDPVEIHHRIKQYLADGTADILQGVGSNNPASRGSFRIHTTIDLHSLAGLQYYNLAVRAFNAQDFRKAEELIEKAEWLYPGQRVEAIRSLIVSYR